MTDEMPIRIKGLSKHFGRFKKIKAVDDASLEVGSRQVYGFLGPNGAGKTTSIRMMLGLMHPTAGQAFLFGEPVHSGRSVPRRVGALVEGAAFYPYLSGRRNLEVIARTRGEYQPKRIDEVLELVSLTERAKQRFKHYSMGMKQRLGLAAAMLHDPDLLILDEPTNGLDPAGIQEMRVFIRELVDVHGKTVFLSSHMLNEVEQICDRVAIIRRGKVVFEGTVADVAHAAREGAASAVLLDVQPLEKALSLLAERWSVQPVRNSGQDLLSVQIAQAEVPDLARRLIAGGIDVFGITPERHSLEDFFLKVTQKTDTAELPSVPKIQEANDGA